MTDLPAIDEREQYLSRVVVSMVVVSMVVVSMVVVSVVIVRLDCAARVS